MKRLSKKISNWGIAGLGFFLAAFTYGLYRMYAVVYGPPPAYLYGSPTYEISDNDSISSDTVMESDNIQEKHP